MSDKSLTLKDADFWVGSLVCSKRGHDKGRVYLVKGHRHDESTIRLLLVNGAHRTFWLPKAKNPKQVTFLEKVLSGEEVAALNETNPQSGEADALVRRLIESYHTKKGTN